MKPGRRIKAKGEFFEFRFYVKILGLEVTAFIFWLPRNALLSSIVIE
jgi:hypothetical protein